MHPSGEVVLTKTVSGLGSIACGKGSESPGEAVVIRGAQSDIFAEIGSSRVLSGSKRESRLSVTAKGAKIAISSAAAMRCATRLWDLVNPR